MHRVSTFLLLAAALCAPGACLAQGQAQAAPRAASASAEATPSQQASAAPRTDETRSAFGRVMAVMIAALQHQASEPVSMAPPVRTTAAGTPMDIEVGAAFSDAMATPEARARTTAPTDLTLSQAALAGPD